MTNREYIGKQLAMLRKERGLTIRQVAEQAGINYTNVCKIENGKYNISVDIIDKLCLALGGQVKIERINTLEGLRDFVNSHEEWSLTANKIIESNNWTDETHNEYGICNDGVRRLYFSFNSSNNLIADIKDM